MGVYRNLQLFFSHDSTWFLKNRLLGFGPNALSGRKMEVLGAPHLYHHLSYLNISFQEKMKSEKGPEKHILWDIRAASAPNRILDRPWNWVRVACQGNQSKQANYVPSESLSMSPIQAFWRSCRYVNGLSIQIRLRPKYPSGLISVTRRRKNWKQKYICSCTSLAFQGDDTFLYSLIKHALNINQSHRKRERKRERKSLSSLENSSLRSAKPMENNLGRSKFRPPYYPSHSYSKGQPEAVTPWFIITVMEKQGRRESFISPPEFIHSTNMTECLQWALNHSCWMNKENSKEIKDVSHHCAFLQQCMKF